MSTDIITEDTCLIQAQENPRYVDNLVNKFKNLDIPAFEKMVVFQVFATTQAWVDAFWAQQDILDLEVWVKKIIAENKNK